MHNLKSLLPLGIISVLAVIVISCSSPPVPSNITVVNMETNGLNCTPNKIDTAQGFLMKISLKNSGTTDVSFVFPDAPYTFSAPAGQTVLGNFTAPTKTGTYKFQCMAAGQAQAITQGEIQVKNSQ